jgi:hypothetical protein
MRFYFEVFGLSRFVTVGFPVLSVESVPVLILICIVSVFGRKDLPCFYSEGFLFIHISFFWGKTRRTSSFLFPFLFLIFSLFYLFCPQIYSTTMNTKPLVLVVVCLVFCLAQVQAAKNYLKEDTFANIKNAPGNALTVFYRSSDSEAQRIFKIINKAAKVRSSSLLSLSRSALFLLLIPFLSLPSPFLLLPLFFSTENSQGGSQL